MSDENIVYTKVYDVKINIISPVVIFSGDSYGLMEVFPINRNDLTGKILDMNKLLSKLDNYNINKLIDSFTAKNFKVARNLIERNLKTSESSVLFTKLAWERLYNHPEQEVGKVVTDIITGKPYIPGSSIKGALRTAFLEKKRRIKKYIKAERKDKEFEWLILENNKGILGDPFKNIMISDFFIDNSNLVIGDLKVGTGIPSYSGMTDAWCLHNKNSQKSKDVIAKGTIVVKYPNGGAKVSMNELLSSLSFYDEKFLDKEAWKKDVGAQELWQRCKKESRREEEYFIRLGHYTGIENKTFDLSIETRNGIVNTKNITGGKSRPKTMDNTYPLGFCLISVKERKDETNN